MSRQSVAKAHQKIQELSWEPQYHTPVSHYGTDYTFQKAQKKDPLKQVLRSYFPMQEEKDHRVYGAQDGAIRGNMFRQVQERWLEWQKLFLSIIPLPEISAARAMRSSLLFRYCVPNPELHNGQAIQMIATRSATRRSSRTPQAPVHEQLHRPGGLQLKPAQLPERLLRARSAAQFAEGFITGDAITAASIYASRSSRRRRSTNTLFVAMPAEAAANVLTTCCRRSSTRCRATRLTAHLQRLRHPADGSFRRVQPPASRAPRPALCLVEQQPPGGRRRDRARSSSTESKPTGARTASPTPKMWRRWILRRLLPQLPRAAGEVRPGHPARPHRAWAWDQIWNKGYVHEVAQFLRHPPPAGSPPPPPTTGRIDPTWRPTRSFE